MVSLPQSANTRHLYLPVKRLGMKLTLLSDAYNFSQVTTHNILKQSKNPEIRDFIKLQPLKTSKLTLFFIKTNRKIQKKMFNKTEQNTR